MTRRLNIAEHSPELLKKFNDFNTAAHDSAIEAPIQHLVRIRASQINGCAFCVDMHVKQAKIHGERELRLHHVAIWWESQLFSERERAAFEWTETLTHLPAHGVPDEVYERVRAQFSEKEISDLSFLIVAINGWNRISVGFRNVPGSLDALYGLGKAGLS